MHYFAGCLALLEIIKLTYFKIVKKLLATWVQSSNYPSVRGDRSNRERRRPRQTFRHGYRNTLLRLGFTDGTNNVLRDWMSVARDRGRWEALLDLRQAPLRPCASALAKSTVVEIIGGTSDTK